MTDRLRFEPAECTVRAGETTRFEGTNAGEIVHEFLIGDCAAQEAFEMSEGHGMQHDTDVGVSVEPGQSEVSSTYVEAGELLACCHDAAITKAGWWPLPLSRADLITPTLASPCTLSRGWRS